MSIASQLKSLSVAGQAVAIVATLFAAPAAWSQAELDEITVTARYREESLQDAGLAIDAISADALYANGVTSAEDAANLNPALTITNGGGINYQLFMRGVGNKANNDYLDPAIILTYDGVPLARGAGAAVAQFYDLERVEILKGPQGTLYGKNATGGVMNVIPAKPRLGETGGHIRGSLGNYSAVDLSAALNVPVGENSAFRFAGAWVEHDGYNMDGTNDAGTLSLRAQFLSDVSESVTVRFAADYSDIDSVGAGTTGVGSYTPAGLATYIFSPSGLPANEGQNTPAGNAYRETILAAPGFGFLDPIADQWYTDGQITGVNAEINISASYGDWTIIPAWRESEQDSKFGQPGFNSGWWQSTVTQTSLEVRLQGEGSELIDYLVGAYYFDEDMEGNNTFDQEFVLPLQDYTQTAESWAVFGQLTWNFSDTTRLLTGARYSDDTKSMDGSINNFIVFCGGLPPNLITPPGSFAQGCAVPGNLPHFPTFDTVEQANEWLVSEGWASVFIPIPPGNLIPLNNGVGEILHAISPNQSGYSSNEPTYRVALEQDFAEDSMLYVSFESGYRSGGLQPNTGLVYAPETVDAYTVGAKNRFLGGSLQFNAEIFYWDYKDQQITYFTLTEDGVLENLTDNVGKATSQGVDLDLQWLAGENTLISGKLQYLDASYDELFFETSPPRDNINCPYTITGVTSDGVTPALLFNCSGNDAIFSPEWWIQAGIQQSFPMGQYEFIVALDSTFIDDQVTGFTNLPHEVIEAHTMTNIAFSLTSPEGDWSVTAFARNLEDENRVVATQPALIGLATAQYGPDMTYGVRANFNF